MTHRQRTSLILALLCFAVAAFIAMMAGAQNVAEMPLIREAPAQTVPLTCPKYQHKQYVCHVNDGTCGEECVDDTIKVTEREWQELQDWRNKAVDGIREARDFIAAQDARMKIATAALESTKGIIECQDKKIAQQKDRIAELERELKRKAVAPISTKPGCCDNCTLPNVPRCKAAKVDRRAR